MPRRPGERVMPPCRFAPLAAILVSVAVLFASNTGPGKGGAGQEPTDKPASPVSRKITLQENRIALSKALETLSEKTKLLTRSGLDEDPDLKLNLKEAGYWQ